VTVYVSVARESCTLLCAYGLLVEQQVELTDYDYDGAYVALRFRIDTAETNMGKADDAVRKIAGEVEEAAEQAADEVGQRIAELAARLSGWGSETLDALVDAVETARTPDDKGRTLEELCSRLFASVPGCAVTGRVRTETEEIDISVLNDSAEPRLRREGVIGLYLPLLELQSMKPQSAQQIWIVVSNGVRIIYIDLKRLEQSPVFNVVSVLRSVVDSCQPLREYDARG